MRTVEEIYAYVRGRWESVNERIKNFIGEDDADDFDIAERSAYANVLRFIAENETEDESETD